MKVRVRQLGIGIFILITLFQSYLSYFFNLFQYFDEIVVVILLIHFTFFKTHIKNMTSKCFNMCIVLFCFLGIISYVINSGILTINVLLALFLSVKFLLYLKLSFGLNIRKRDKDTIYKVIVFVGYFDTYMMMVNWFIPQLYIHYFPYAKLNFRLGLPVSQGIFVQLAMNSFFLMFLSLHFFVKYNHLKKGRDLVRFGYFLLFMLSTMRMKTIIGFFIVVCMGILIFNKNLIRKVQMMVLMIIGFLILIVFVWDQLVFTYRQYFTVELGMSARMAMTQTSVQIAKDFFPLGVGFGKFGSSVSRTYYSEYYYLYKLNFVSGLTPDHASAMLDVYWPSILGETGFIGLLVYVIVFIVVIKTLFFRINKIIHGNFRVEKLTDIAFGLLVFTESIVESMGESVYNSCLQFLLIGLVTGIAYKEAVEKHVFI